MEDFLVGNVSVTLLIKMLLSSPALFACITSLKETLASKHMGIRLGRKSLCVSIQKNVDEV